MLLYISKNKLLLFAFILYSLLGLNTVNAQNEQDGFEMLSDSVGQMDLMEVILIAPKRNFDQQRQQKPLASIEEILETSKNLRMIKRGAYAWEPAINNMTSERLAVTIDGMRIFEACTDKMDPITSYVATSNLEEAQIGSGQQGSIFGNTIGGGLNLKVDKGDFQQSGWTGRLESGYESNNQLRIFGGKVSYADSLFYIDADASYRKADNYKAGGNKEIEFSQYTKYNASVNTGVKLAEGKSLHGSFIYDEARDVGYPALTMDVSQARAFISSLSYQQDKIGEDFRNWETKIYYNTIKHVMDDSKRPDVPIRMDMPGWSETAGFYSQSHMFKNKHRFLFKVDGYYNKSLAEMTMYPPNPNESSMFMLTWPDVRTTNVGIYAEDKITLGMAHLKLSTRLSYHNQYVADDFGLNSNKIFYPDMDRSNTRFLKNFSAQFHQLVGDFDIDAGLSYGERAPSVSEGYGFFLFNSFDNYDYIGDPDLKTEGSAEANLSLTYKIPEFEISAKGSYFRVYDYIIGKVDPNLDPMAIGADGVKVYENLKYADLYNATLAGEYKFTPALKLNAQISYHHGRDHEKENLPLISPVSYRSSLEFHKNDYTATIFAEGAATQSNFNPEYGENKTPAYALLSASIGKRIYLNNNDLYIKAGVENIFDKFYTTYTDWNNIPQMGRNIYINASFSFN